VVSVRADGSTADASAAQASISADGRIVAFASTANDLVATSGPVALAAIAIPPRSEVYARDIVAGETVLISVRPDGLPGGGRSVMPSIGANGRLVAFAANSPALGKPDNNSADDVFVRDMPPEPSIGPSPIDFGAQEQGTASEPHAATLRNDGWGPLAVGGTVVTGAAPDFPVLVNGCAGAVLHRAEACTVTLGFAPTETGPRVGQLRVTNDFDPGPRTVRLRGIGLPGVPKVFNPTLELDPPTGPPGFVTMAVGSGFPPGGIVGLAWSRGITPTLPPIVADGDGRIRVQVLIFHHDVLGDRQLTASPAGGPTFNPAVAGFRVSTAPSQPPSSVVLRLDDQRPGLISRR
jgi:hypothetical protein